MAVRLRITMVAAFALASAIARPAHADWDFQLGMTLAGGWLRDTPDFTSDKLSTAARDIRESTLRSRGGLAMMGLGFDTDIIVDDRWKIPAVGGNAFWAVGSYASVLTSMDGSVARLRPWSAWRGDILMPGLGRRWKHRRYMIEAAVRTGLSWVQLGGSVAAGADRVELANTQAFTFLVQAEIEGCRRLDPTTRVCIQVVPRIYEHSWLNGGTIGLRYEWGR